MNAQENDLIAVSARARRLFPDHVLDVAFQVCLPIYELRLRVVEMAEHRLSTTARFMLQLSNLGVSQPAEFVHLLGVSEEYVKGTAAELLSAELVVQRPDLGIAITDNGREILSQGGRSLHPRNRHPVVPYDPLVKRVVSIDTERLLDRTVVRKNGYFVPPTGPRRPRLSAVRLEEVREYGHNYGRRRDKSEIVEVADIKDVRLRYRDDVIIVKLDAPESNASNFAAYHARQYLEEESAALQRLADRGVDLVPVEFKQEGYQVHTSVAPASEEESSLLVAIEDLDRAVADSELAVAESVAMRGTTQSAVERESLNNRIRELETAKSELESKLAELETRLRDVTNGETRLLKTEEHRQVLLDAIDRSQSELTLVSAWINRRAFDYEVSRKIASAIERGVTVRIAWGLGARGAGPDAYRNRAKAESALSALKRVIPKNVEGRLVIKRADTHEKFIICDDLFCAWGSFNWLSYRGELDEGYRRETSLYSERCQDILMWKNNAWALFDS